MFAHEFGIKLPFSKKLQIGVGKHLIWDYFVFDLSVTKRSPGASPQPAAQFSLEVFGFFIDLSLVGDYR
jgi:hypothetical protein